MDLCCRGQVQPFVLTTVDAQYFHFPWSKEKVVDSYVLRMARSSLGSICFPLVPLRSIRQITKDADDAELVVSDVQYP